MTRQARPHFIGVGPEKTATTWLFQNLAQHPDVWLVPVKETCYFFEHEFYPGESWRKRFALTNTWHHRRYWNYLTRRPGHLLKYPRHILEPWRAAWDWRYLFDVHDDEWYMWSFKFAKAHQIGGEISPPYFFMPEPGIAHMRRLVPHARIIMFLRNPVEWRWSFAKMDLVKNRGANIQDVSENQFANFFDWLKPRSFAATIKRWYKYFPRDQIFVCFFDRLGEDPVEVFHELCQFLEIDPERMPTSAVEGLQRRVNTGADGTLPTSLAHRLAQDSQDDVEALCGMFDIYPARWREEIAKLQAPASDLAMQDRLV